MINVEKKSSKSWWTLSSLKPETDPYAPANAETNSLFLQVSPSKYSKRKVFLPNRYNMLHLSIENVQITKRYFTCAILKWQQAVSNFYLNETMPVEKIMN